MRNSAAPCCWPALPWRALRRARQTILPKPVRLIVPYPPGGTTDFVAREIANKLGEAWGRQVVIDNRPGAGTLIGLNMGAKAASDGYTITFGTSAGLAVNPALGVKMPFDPRRDFAPIGLMVYVPYLLVVNPALPVRNIKELIDLGEDAARQAQLRVARRRHAQSPRHRAAQHRRRRQIRARAL